MNRIPSTVQIHFLLKYSLLLLAIHIWLTMFLLLPFSVWFFWRKVILLLHTLGIKLEFVLLASICCWSRSKRLTLAIWIIRIQSWSRCGLKNTLYSCLKESWFFIAESCISKASCSWSHLSLWVWIPTIIVFSCGCVQIRLNKR
jgi:hypothetical protein